MADIYIQRKNHSAVIHAVANATLNVAGNSSVSDLVATGGLPADGGEITKVFWSVGNNNRWTVSRGANVVLELFGSDTMDFAGEGCALTKDAAENLDLSLSGGNGFLIIEVKLNGTQKNEQFL